MKKLSLLLIAILFAVTGILAQTPNQFKYQAVLRNADGTIMANEAVTVDISVLQSSASGTSVFNETHNVTTTAQGLINLNIGSIEDLSVIDWTTNTYFIQINVNGTTMGTSQLLSVPYAMTAKTVENDQVNDADADPNNEIQNLSLNGNSLSLTNDTSTIDLSLYLDDKTVTFTNGTGINVTGTYPNFSIAEASKHYVGELYGGGVVFWVDNTGQHGLIISMIDLSTSQIWSNISNQEIGSSAQSDWDGNSNTSAIINQSGHSNSAAKLCTDYSNADYGTGIYNDWYLPSITELNHIWNNFYEIQKALDSDGNSTTTTIEQTIYWSSSEFSSTNPWQFSFSSGYISTTHKDYYRCVRAVRAF